MADDEMAYVRKIKISGKGVSWKEKWSKEKL